ncbi:DUF5808 domain-containing protein [Trueperella sp. LYQ141]|uniref:DUF5808 domain-containing protein n=1 Tax=Trueperella sp. LYQ141 TaxID=3391058 RepID=UPI003982F932
MRLRSTTEDGTRRFLGIPVSFPTRSNTTGKILRCFEPENPAIFVPRTAGIGWDLNIGAIAVKLGLIRPDDSLPDLEAYIPPTTRRALASAPWIGAASTCLYARNIARARRVVTKWHITGLPQRYSSGKAAAALSAGTSIALAALPIVISRIPTGNTSESESEPTSTQPASALDTARSADIVLTAHALGLQSLLLFSAEAARREIKHPHTRQLIASIGLLAAPIVTSAVLVATVKQALNGVSRALKSSSHTPASQPMPAPASASTKEDDNERI